MCILFVSCYWAASYGGAWAGLEPSSLLPQDCWYWDYIQILPSSLVCCYKDHTSIAFVITDPMCEIEALGVPGKQGHGTESELRNVQKLKKERIPKYLILASSLSSAGLKEIARDWEEMGKHKQKCCQLWRALEAMVRDEALDHQCREWWGNQLPATKYRSVSPQNS